MAVPEGFEDLFKPNRGSSNIVPAVLTTTEFDQRMPVFLLDRIVSRFVRSVEKSRDGGKGSPTNVLDAVNEGDLKTIRHLLKRNPGGVHERVRH